MKEIEKGLVYTNDNCIGCNKCIRSCSCIGTCVSTSPDANGVSRIEVDGNRCVACGACFDVCEHNARSFVDDTERFFEDLKRGEKISVFLAPSFLANYPDQYSKVLGGLKALGVNHIISVSFGADITTWGYINYIKEHDFTGGISQPCPAVVGYIERYIPELLPKLFPVQSPLMCAAIYAHKELGISDKFAFIGPCIAKKLEIDDPNNRGLVSYNVTFAHLMEYAEKHNVYGEPYTDEIEYGLGSIYPMPGGLKENVLWLLGDDVFVRQVEGEKRLYHYLEQNKERLRGGNNPFLFVDALNCEKGCLCGTGTEMSLSVTDNALINLHEIKNSVKKNTSGSAWSKYSTPEERLASLNEQFSGLKLEDYIRSYTDLSEHCTLRIPDEEELEMIFLEMNKLDEASRHINCSCCGYDSCREMAIAIHNGFNHKDNCIHYLKDMFIQKTAETDVMTGLPNAAGFRTFINRIRANGTLTDYNAVSLNLRNTALANKKFGKQKTDAILIRYAEHLMTFIGDDEFVGRLSGDNFIFAVHKDKTDAVLKLTEGVRISVAEGPQDHHVTPLIQATAGCLDIDDEELDSEGILGRCATALNDARYNKHVPYVFSTSEMHSKAIQQKQVISVFNDALKNGEFTPFYQPKVNSKTNTLVGAEALARWIRDGNLIPPGDFIPVLEGDYRICELDFYMLEQVCKDLRRWIDEGMEPVCISTNFSRRNLSDPDFSQRITELISRYDIPKQYIEVELTETFSAEENKLLGRFINDMHDVGILIAIDDFGTGYSSLNLLREIPADLLKLDKSFIDGHTGAKRDSVVVSNIAKMANELNMGIIAEGVERREQVEFLQSVNIDMAQGYLYDKPLTKADFEKRLKDKIYKSE